MLTLMILGCNAFTNFDDRFEDGDEIAVRYADSMPDVEARDADERTLLSVAALRGSVKVTQRLLDRGASTKARDSYGFLPLELAARTGSAATVRELLQGGADINGRGGDLGGTALDEAIIQNHPDIVNLLLASGADVNARDRLGETALFYVARIPAAADIFFALIGAHADAALLDSRGWAAIHVASAVDNAEFVSRYVSSKTDIGLRTTSGRTALDLASMRHSDLTGDILWRAGAPASSPVPLPPLFEAARLDEPVRIENLLAHGADRNLTFEGQTPLQVAQAFASQRAIRILTAGASQNPR